MFAVFFVSNVNSASECRSIATLLATLLHVCATCEPRITGAAYYWMMGNLYAANAALLNLQRPEPNTAEKYVGRHDWTRTNDPHHVKVVL